MSTFCHMFGDCFTDYDPTSFLTNISQYATFIVWKKIMTLTKEVVEFANALHIQDDTQLLEIIEESREIAERVEAGDVSLHPVLDILIGAIEAYEDDNFKFPAVRGN